ncbi:MAG: hypothetical protein Q7U11_00390 [Phenylobacterium sp.]|nr:hypothetical protein [Phenylobacterium sp.]MDO8324676.1 hypothetical protein [Phenylobacterium sp.]MDO9244916.1 hypothetical protein [Phenylobacterium sp.]MDP3635694.1 hypothetical protein [Phenylobacterium sp.]
MREPAPPSNHPAFAPFLVQLSIDSISVNPDSFVAVKTVVAAAEKTAHTAPEPTLATG